MNKKGGDNMKKTKLKPVEERKIPNPKSGFFLKKEGEVVELNKYWRRRLLFGEVVEVKKEMKKTIPKKSLKNKGEE